MDQIHFLSLLTPIRQKQLGDVGVVALVSKVSTSEVESLVQGSLQDGEDGVIWILC
jgi:hypothetical protein